LVKLYTLDNTTPQRRSYTTQVSFDNILIKDEQRVATQALRDDDKYHLPHARTTALKKIPLYSLPKEWNKHNEMRYQENKTTFK
jgi:hypothetical protein